MALLAGYSYRKKIDLTGAAGLGTNSHVLLKVGATSSATGEDFDVGGHAESFPTDIRFTNVSAETITNGDFTSNIDDWTLDLAGGSGTIAWDAGTLKFTQAADSPVHMYAYQSITTVVGKTYSFTAEVTDINPDSHIHAGFDIGTSAKGQQIFASGSIGEGVVAGTFVATGTTTWISLRWSGTNSSTCNFDNVSVTSVEEELDFYLEKTESSGDTALAYLWVEVADSMESSASIYIYYGKEGDSSGSNGDNTFLLFEDFEDLTTGQALEGQGGWVFVSGGGHLTVQDESAKSPPAGDNVAENATKTGSSAVYKAFAATANVGLVFNVRSTADDVGTLKLPKVTVRSDANLAVKFQVNGTANDFEYVDSGVGDVIILDDYTVDTWYRLEGRFKATDNNGDWRYVLSAGGGNGTFAGFSTQEAAWTTLNRLYLSTNDKEDVYFDQIFIYKIATDGSVGTFDAAGDEERYISMKPISLTATVNPGTQTNLIPQTATTISMLTTINPATLSESGGWEAQAKNTADWTAETKN